MKQDTIQIGCEWAKKHVALMGQIIKCQKIYLTLCQIEKIIPPCDIIL